jgi:hypothetical protein
MLTRYTMPSRKLMFAAALAALAAGWLAAWRRARARRLARPQAQPRELQTWEGEGGGVPVEGSHTAAQVRPDGAAAAATHPSRFASAIDA